MLALVSMCLATCKPSFSFTGVSLDPNIKTFFIQNFYSDALDGPANLGITFSESMRAYFQRNTPLNPVPTNGDLAFSGSIKNYEVKPIAAGGGDLQNAQLQRLTITISVDYVNNYQPDKNFEKNFSQYADFDASQNLQDVEATLIEDIFDRIIFDIFNSTVADW